MLTQKTFHLPMPWRTARARLARFAEYRRKCVYVQDALVPERDVIRLLFKLPFHFQGHIDLALVEGETPTQLLFRSQGGAIQLIGLMEYFEVRPDMTEIVLTVDYVITSRLHRWLNYATRNVERFLNLNLALIEAHFQC